MKPKFRIILMHVIIALLACFAHVNSKFHCVGTCYSGQVNPEPEDIVQGKHLKGYSYKNITTDDPKKCYSSCIHDCRCKACQMQYTRCELLDNDKTTRANDFVDEPGYVYYDLKQEFYKGKSHMVEPGKCNNGCCRSQPCMNGGTCVEHCDTPKERFSCRCSKQFTGKVCEKNITRCYDILKYSSSNTIPVNRLNMYTITRTDTGMKTSLYCAFTSNQSWTIIESFSLANNDFKPIYSNNSKIGPQDYWNNYRIPLDTLKYVRSTATLFRATCDFPKRVDSLTPDYLLGNLSDVDITSPKEHFNRYKKYMHINILGHECFDCTAATYGAETEHIHIDIASRIQNCDLKPSKQHLDTVDYFGLYKKHSQRFKCTATSQSTTQWWLGEQI